MPNKREFKKYVDALGASVLDQVAAAYDNIPESDKEGLQKAFTQVLGAVGAAKANANRFFDRGRKGFESVEEYSKSKATFFKKLFEKIENDFSNEINEALKNFNAALPESVKAANKEGAN